MAVYTQWGYEVEIIGYDGEGIAYNSFNEPFNAEWVKIRYLNNGHEREFAVHNLRADGGIGEIEAAIAPFRPTADNS